MGSISLPVPLTEFSYPLNPSVISPALAFTFNQLLPPCSLGQLLVAAGPPPRLFLGFPNEWERAPLWGKAGAQLSSGLRKQCGEELVQGSESLAFPRAAVKSPFRAI